MNNKIKHLCLLPLCLLRLCLAAIFIAVQECDARNDAMKNRLPGQQYFYYFFSA